MKKMVYAISIASMLWTSSIGYAAVPGQLNVDDKPIRSDAAPIVDKGRVLVPIRAFAESIGASVTWDSQSKTAAFGKWSQTVKLTVGRNYAMLGGYPQSGKLTLDVSIENRNNRIYVPLRSLSGMFGYKVTAENNVVSIHSPVSKEQQSLLLEGDLSKARQLAMGALSEHVQYGVAPLAYTSEREGYSITYVFPEGEAARFYTIVSGKISFYELQGGFFVVTWEAHVPVGAKTDLELFLDNKITDQTGDKPADKMAYFYFRKGEIVNISTRTSGSVDADGKVTQLGYKSSQEGEILQQTGTLSFQLPGETRKQ